MSCAPMQRLTRWGRADQVAKEVLLWALTVAGLVLMVVCTIREVRADRLTVPVDLNGTTSGPVPGAAAGRLSLEPVEQAILVVRGPTLADRLADVGPTLVLFGAMALVGWLMLRILVTLRTGDPFSRRNWNRVNGLALTLFLAAHAYAVAEWLGRRHFSEATHDLLGAGVSIERWLAVPLWPLLTAVTLGAVAEFLRRGAALRDDVDGLV